MGGVMLCQKSLHESCRMGRRIVVMKLISSTGHCECDGPTVHKLSQQRLTADWLAPRESDCSQMHSKASSDWLSSYIKATRTVLRIFKMSLYFPDSPLYPLSFMTSTRISIPVKDADPRDRAVKGVDLWLLACWDWRFQSRRSHGCLSFVTDVCCQVEVPASGWSLVQRSPTKRGESDCDREALIMRRPWPTGTFAEPRKEVLSQWKQKYNGVQIILRQF
jgi:hypothetical protein